MFYDLTILARRGEVRMAARKNAAARRHVVNAFKLPLAILLLMGLVACKQTSKTSPGNSANAHAANSGGTSGSGTTTDPGTGTGTGTTTPTPPAPTGPAADPPFAVYNNSNNAVSGQPVTLAVAFQIGDAPAGTQLQLQGSNGASIPVQEDSCSKWNQDTSRKVCSISFVEPDSIAAHSYATYQLTSVSGTANTTANVTPATITANSNICVKTSNLTETGGAAEAGTWDLVCLNNVLSNFSQYSGSTGYGANPKGGWEFYASGPNRTGIHAFQYARRESDGAIHNWLRTDIWVDFWGSGSTPCPCSVAVQVSQPNTWGPVSGGTVGSTPQGGYVFAAQVLNGSTVIYNLGGNSDGRTVTSLSSSSFSVSNGQVSLPANSWVDSTVGVWPVAFSGSGLPAGLVAGQVYYTQAGVSEFLAADTIKLYPAVCYTSAACTEEYFPAATSAVVAMKALGNYVDIRNNGPLAYVKLCPTSACVATTSDTAVAAGTSVYLAKGANTTIAYMGPSNGDIFINYRQGFSNTGSGSMTMTPLVMTTPWAGFLGLDNAGQRFWINASGAAMPPPPLVAAQDFTYLTQKSRAVPPYITSLFGKLLPVAGTWNYYPGTYYLPFDMNTTGDGPGDTRIGYIDHTGTYALFMPQDPNATRNAMVMAAGFGMQHMYHIDERVGLPDVFNNGPAKNGVTYPTLGVVQPNQRTYPYSGNTPWLVPSTAVVDAGPIIERYGTWLDPSHMPTPGQAPFLLTGAPEWQNQMVQEANAIVGNMQIPTATVGSNTYYRVAGPALNGFFNNQTRGVAWQERAVAQADFFQPAASPISQYLHDLVADDVAYMDDYSVNGATATEKSLGYYWNDTHANSAYQWWQDDFVFLSYGITAWRGEYPHATAFLTNYFAKQVIGRMDSASGGCLWAGPERIVAPYGTAMNLSTLPTTWNGVYANSVVNWGNDWGSASWAGCAAQTGGLAPDGAGTTPATPNGLTSIMAVSPAIASLLGIQNGASLYNSIRTLQYAGTCGNCGLPLSFTSFRFAGSTLSEPVFAIGPLGAAN